jgi:hypothetical protein
VNSIEAQEASAQAQPQVVGVRLDKGEVIRATHSVVSGVGVLCTFTVSCLSLLSFRPSKRCSSTYFRRTSCQSAQSRSFRR